MTRLQGTLDDYRHAPSRTGPLGATWADKPHRLLYDLVAEIEQLRRLLDAAKAQAEAELSRGYTVDVRHRAELDEWARLARAELAMSWAHLDQSALLAMNNPAGDLARWLLTRGGLT